MLRKAIYPHVESLLNNIATNLGKQGFSPNQLTLAGLTVNFLAGWIFAAGNFFLGGLFLLIASLGDLLDGPLARVTKKTSNFGAFLDSTVDRYSDFFLFGGLALHFAKQDQGGWFLICMGIIAGSFVTSYAKARAENFIERCDVGMVERAERVIGLALAAWIPFLLPLILWALLIGSNATAIERILYTQKKLSERTPSPATPS